MGREATCKCRVGRHSYIVKALLESRSLILRGEFKLSIALSDITAAKVVDGRLQFDAAGEKFALELGNQDASRWLTILMRPAPTLADKLGLKGNAKAYVIGSLDDEVLLEALAGHQIDSARLADICIALVKTKEQLDAAAAAHQAASTSSFWIAYPKGNKAGLSESVVRETMRSRGYMDTKVSAVSEQLTATRYNRQA